MCLFKFYSPSFPVYKLFIFYFFIYKSLNSKLSQSLHILKHLYAASFLNDKFNSFWIGTDSSFSSVFWKHSFRIFLYVNFSINTNICIAIYAYMYCFCVIFFLLVAFQFFSLSCCPKIGIDAFDILAFIIPLRPLCSSSIYTFTNSSILKISHPQSLWFFSVLSALTFFLDVLLEMSHSSPPSLSLLCVHLSISCVL